jgi:O-antigen/teichoic acid export membrane protein
VRGLSSYFWALWRAPNATLGWSIARYGISITTGPATVLAVAHSYSVELQGYYFTFGSLLALQVVFELGFSTCITQIISHEFASLLFTPDRLLEGNRLASGRLYSVAKLSFKWYGVGAALFFIILGICGEVLFAKRSTGIDWRGPWWLLCCATSLNMLVLPFTALLTGCQQVAWVARASSFQGLVRCAAFVGLAYLGAGLYAIGFASILGLALYSAQCVIHWRGLLRQIKLYIGTDAVDWRREIWPYQWRIAVSWLSGYAIFSTFNPIIFAYSGPEEAGRFGLTWTILQTAGGVAQLFVIVVQPQFGALIARGEIQSLRLIWKDSMFKCMTAISVTMAAVAFALVALQDNVILRGRIVSWGVWLPLLLALILNQGVNGIASLARAEKKEPFLVPSVLAAILVLGGNLLLVQHYGAVGLAWNYLCVTCLTSIFALKILSYTVAFAARANIPQGI